MTISVTTLDSSEVTLRLSEIFYSLQGETTFSGLPTVFIRLTGCPLRCGWCDSAYAFNGGEQKSVPQILDEVRSYKTRYVTVTGGEPLAQAHVHALLSALCDAGYHVSLETSGALSVADVDARVTKIMDIKAPGSGEAERNLWENLSHLQRHDQIKCVIASHDDYDWFKTQLTQRNLTAIVDTLLISPVFKAIEPAELAGWILDDALPVRYQLQLHKQLWGDTPGV